MQRFEQEGFKDPINLKVADCLFVSYKGNKFKKDV
jgi:hypothetical protein